MFHELQVDIVTPEKLAFSGKAQEVRAPGWKGEFGVLPDHTMYLALLRAGRCVVVTEDEEITYVVGRGFAEAGGERVTLLVDSCELASEIDKEAAAKELHEAEAALTEANAWSHTHDIIQTRYDLARARKDA